MPDDDRARPPTADGSTDLTPDGRSTRWDGYRRERRRQLVEVGLEVLNEVGLDFSVDRVVERAGVSRPVIYRQFADRAGLIAAVGERAVEILVEEKLAPALEAEQSLKGRLAEILRALLSFVAQYPVLYRAMAGHESLDGGRSARELRAIVSHVLATLLGEAAVAGGGDPRIVELWSQGIVGFVENGFTWWLDQSSMDAEYLVEVLTDMVWDQLEGFAHRHRFRLGPDDRPALEDLPAYIARNRLP